ncbi:hypothetical protein LSAT2_015588 [Lamellibrachia satsuma]|nr:hypothetical protein LSAT2_015588 [Lamellibrachia satsuma]
MISYQWDNQQLMRRIGDKLIEAGFKVWMDVYDMSGSTLEAMAAAVEEASMVLIAASTKYKDSVSCRTEGEYAYNKRREIVPVIVEPGYTPDGWLGPLVLNHLYFDFTDDTNFEQKMKELINEIQRRGQCMIQCNEGACTRKKTRLTRGAGAKSGRTDENNLRFRVLSDGRYKVLGSELKKQDASDSTNKTAIMRRLYMWCFMHCTDDGTSCTCEASSKRQTLANSDKGNDLCFDIRDLVRRPLIPTLKRTSSCTGSQRRYLSTLGHPDDDYDSRVLESLLPDDILVQYATHYLMSTCRWFVAAKSPLEAMAAAVEDACVVLIAASRKYKDSESCRTEGVYTYNLRRDIVPLIVETGYRPDGWLGPLVLNNLYFDFSKEKTPFEQNMLDLIKELGCRGKLSHIVNDNEVDVVQKVVDSSTVHAAPILPINHTGNHRTHGEDVTDVSCVTDDSVVKQPPPVTMQPPGSRRLLGMCRLSVLLPAVSQTRQYPPRRTARKTERCKSSSHILVLGRLGVLETTGRNNVE